jgi:hypothetical protein
LNVAKTVPPIDGTVFEKIIYNYFFLRRRVDFLAALRFAGFRFAALRFAALRFAGFRFATLFLGAAFLRVVLRRVVFLAALRFFAAIKFLVRTFIISFDPPRLKTRSVCLIIVL